jgi:hypothetical protein
MLLMMRNKNYHVKKTENICGSWYIIEMHHSNESYFNARILTGSLFV